MSKRMYADDPQELRNLYELVEDHEAVAEIDRQNMGQGPRIETTR